MDFTTLQQAVADRGFAQLQDGGNGLARLKRVINRAYTDLCSEELWPFLRKSATSTISLTPISDLRRVESVYSTSTGNFLPHATKVELERLFGDLTTTGTGQYWFMADQTTVRTYPYDATSSYTVTYWKVPTDLSAGGDTPVVPAEWHKLIEDRAVYYLAKDSQQRSDALSDYQLGLPLMRYALLGNAGPTFVAAVGDDC